MVDPLMPGFDRLAGIYRTLEHVAFGQALQRARLAYVSSLRDALDVLVLGDGDGRFLKALVTTSPHARIVSVDASAAMLQRAAAELTDDERARVTFIHADARTFDPGADTFDAIVTLFFLDCFTDGDVEHLVARLSPTLRPAGRWLFADFAIPDRGLARLAAVSIVSVLYAFFRWQTGIEARTLPHSEAALHKAGLYCVGEEEFRAGLIRSALFATARVDT